MKILFITFLLLAPNAFARIDSTCTQELLDLSHKQTQYQNSLVNEVKQEEDDGTKTYELLIRTYSEKYESVIFTIVNISFNINSDDSCTKSGFADRNVRNRKVLWKSYIPIESLIYINN